MPDNYFQGNNGNWLNLLTFGGFTYSFANDNNEMNHHRELDMIEISTFNSQYNASESVAQQVLQGS